MRLNTGLVTSMLATATAGASSACSPESAAAAAAGAASEAGSAVSSPPLEQPASASKSAPSTASHDTRSMNIDAPPILCMTPPPLGRATESGKPEIASDDTIPLRRRSIRPRGDRSTQIPTSVIPMKIDVPRPTRRSREGGNPSPPLDSGIHP